MGAPVECSAASVGLSNCSSELAAIVDGGRSTHGLFSQHTVVIAGLAIVVTGTVVLGTQVPVNIDRTEASLVERCHKNNIPMALVTSSSAESFQIKTTQHKWMNLFSVIVLGDEKLLAKGKPAPDPYLLAAKKLNIAPQECWAVEDSIAGVSSALEAVCYVLFLKAQSEELPKKENLDQHINLRQISHLKEIDQILNEY